ncbi:MAG: hypothetical protein JG781_1026 [Peptococcaceae bacterium]|nr:hypothetical protein [Peptococcaceae bacterium]
MKIAEELDIPYIPRAKNSLQKLKEIYELDYLLVVEQNQVILKGKEVLFWHPSMAVPRLKALREGKNDPMLEAMKLKPGYHVLDCTLGLGSDALVSAYGVGSEGHVTGLEASKYIAFITRWGLENFNGQNTHVKTLLSRITVINQAYEEYLKNQPHNSYEVVYFDPMFRKALHHSPSMNALRPLANHNPLEQASIHEALRVAKFRVVVKEIAGSSEFLKLKPDYVIGGKYSPIAYGVWEKKIP